MKKKKQIFIIALMTCLLIGLATANVAAETYTWKNVQIVGGGFTPGIIYNETEANLIYARMDIGGAYRWDPGNNRWIPLLDWIGFDDWGLTGIVSLATDPIDTDRVYVAAGSYTNSWDPKNGAILRSTDRGATWQRTDLPFKLGGNMPGRGCGERLAIDPHKNSILYLGAPNGNGLWKSSDYGVNWSQVTSFPNPGDYSQDPNCCFGYLNVPDGVIWVTFDKRTGTPGNPTQTIYVGVADLEESIYRTTDGGTNWAAVPGQPTGFIPIHGVLDTTYGYLYVPYGNSSGPYNANLGDLWKYNTATGAWTNISPIPSTQNPGDDIWWGYGGFAVDRQNPTTIMVSTSTSYWPDCIIWRSTNGGTTWSKIWDWARYPSRTFRYTQDVSAAPWLDDYVPGARDPVVSPMLGWMVADLEIDPFNSDKMMYVTGATIYGSDNLTVWDGGPDTKITITVKAMGVEETSVNGLLSPSSGVHLVSGLGDIGGFRHEDMDTVPNTHFPEPGAADIDYAELNPNLIFRVGGVGYVDEGATPNEENKLAAYSSDNAASWKQISDNPPGVSPYGGSGSVAVAANGSRVVWAPKRDPVDSDNCDTWYDVPVHTAPWGSFRTWTACSGIPPQAKVASDRVNPNKFYGFKDGTFYISTNGGASFTATAATGLPNGGDVRFKAVPGIEGDIWLAGGATFANAYGLWHSTNSGAGFTKLTNVDEADSIGFGKAADGETYVALYTSAKINGVRGIYRSIDAGANWVRINDNQHQWGWAGAAITGDPRIYGRVYVGTNGRGIFYGDPGGTSTTTTAATTTTTAATTTTTAATTTTTAASTTTTIGGETMHVDSITVTLVDVAGGKKPRADVVIKDYLGAPVQSATVYGTFTTNVGTQTGSGVTDATGLAVIIGTKNRNLTSATFCVDNVTHATLTYNPSDNVETCDHN